MGRDLVTVMEAAYRLDVGNSAWLSQVARAVHPFLDQGNGVYAFEFDAARSGRLHIDNFVVVGDARIAADLVVQWHDALDAQHARDMYRASRPFATISERLGVAPSTAIRSEPVLAFCRHVGIHDQLTIRAADPTLQGVSICTPLGNVAAAPADQHTLWANLAAHVAAGFRLRRRLSPDDALLDHADAVLDPGGRVAHAVGDARQLGAQQALRQAAMDLDRARGELRRTDPHEAVDIWRGLVSGSWSMVDHFDTDGRRYLVAVRNEPETPDPRALTERERQASMYAAQGHANKEIAYALGISVSTAAGYVSRAMRKLGCSRVGLIELMSALEPAVPAADRDSEGSGRSPTN